MDLFAKYATDKKLEQEGLNYVINDGEESCTLRIGRAGGSNLRFATLSQKLLAEAEKTYRKKDSIPASVMREITIRVFAETVLLGWEGITDQDGNEVPYSKEAALKFLRCQDMLEDVSKIAGDREFFLLKPKNVVTVTSDGTQSTEESEEAQQDLL
jgi:hypothetical protein